MRHAMPHNCTLKNTARAQNERKIFFRLFFVEVEMSGQNKKLLYVGGLAEEVDEKMLHAAFIPFGDIIGEFQVFFIPR